MIRKNKRHPFLLTAFILIATIVGSMSIIISEVNRPVHHDSKVAKAIARKNTNLKKIDEVSKFIYNKVEYTVTGIKKDGTKVFVVIMDNGKKVTVYKRSSGITKNKAIHEVKKDSHLKKITSARFGIIKDKPVWVISYLNQENKLVVKTLDFKTGTELKSVTTY